MALLEVKLSQSQVMMLFRHNKTLLSSPVKLGETGRVFRVYNQFFEIVENTEFPRVMFLEDVANKLYSYEGCISPQGYFDSIIHSYPDVKFDDPMYLTWVRRLLPTVDYLVISRAMHVKQRRVQYNPKLVNVVKTTYGSRYTRKTTNGATPKQKSIDKRTKEYKMMQMEKAAA
jgi:hypothetical protein